MQKARKIWERVSMILGTEGDKPKMLRMVFKAVVQAVLIFGAEIWVMTPHMGWALGV